MTTITRPSLASSSRVVIVGAAVAVALGVSLALYAFGQAAGGSFSYTQSGKPNSVDALSVAIMSAGPLAVGLALIAVLAPRWPGLLGVAAITAPVLALRTIALMTLPAHFDSTSTAFLCAMHVALVPISLLAIAALRVSSTSSTG